MQGQAGHGPEISHVFSEIGVSILLFESGLETDLKEMFRVGPSASAVAALGILLPFGLGFAYWYLFDPSIGVHPPGSAMIIGAFAAGIVLSTFLVPPALKPLLERIGGDGSARAAPRGPALGA